MGLKVEVGDDGMERCQWFARHLTDSLKKKQREGMVAICRDGIATDYHYQLLGRMGEWAAAEFFGLDPLKALDWEIRDDNTGDKGIDFWFEGVSFDAKATTTWRPPRLMWPTSRSRRGDRPKAHIMICVSGKKADNHPYLDMAGWIPSRLFDRVRHVAPDGPSPHRLEVGTEYLEEREIIQMSEWGDKNALANWSINVMKGRQFDLFKASERGIGL